MRRWRNAPHWDGYVDSEHVYPPVTALELVNGRRFYRFDIALRRDDPALFDRVVTEHARTRSARCHPWKRARTNR